MSRLRSLWQASLNATKRVLTWNMEDLVPPSEKCIFNFNSKEELRRWHLYSDSEYGGMSSASLEINDGGNELRGVFSGKLSHDVAEGQKWNISQNGFCGMCSKKFDGFIDLDPYDTIALKIRGDGRCYISTIYTENWVNSPGQQEDNSWQAFVFVPKDNRYITKVASNCDSKSFISLIELWRKCAFGQIALFFSSFGQIATTTGISLSSNCLIGGSFILGDFLVSFNNCT